MMEYNVNPNESVYLRLQVKSTDSGLYPRVQIYAIDAPTTVVATVDLTYLSNGLYGGTWTNNGERKKYFTQTIVYTDAGYTTPHSLIRPDSDSINVGFNVSGGGVFGGRGGFQRTHLTPEEIEQIAKKVLEYLSPSVEGLYEELSKKSEFDPATTPVKTDLILPDEQKLLDAISSLDQRNLLVSISTKLNKLQEQKDYSPELQRLKEDLIQMIDAARLDPLLLDQLATEIKNSRVDLSGFITEEHLNKLKAELDLRPELSKLGEQLFKRDGIDIELTQKSEFLEMVRVGCPIDELYQAWKKLSKENKRTISEHLYYYYPEVIRKLVDLSEADGIALMLTEAKDKKTVLSYLLQTGTISKKNLAIIKSFIHA